MQRRGHLYWADVEKRRPVLVISADARNERANDVLVIPCSTTLRPAPTHVWLARGEGGVPQESVLKCEQITTLRKQDLDPAPLGAALRPSRMAAVERAVLRAIGIPIY
jgi:mRNA interferase MazF